MHSYNRFFVHVLLHKLTTREYIQISNAECDNFNWFQSMVPIDFQNCIVKIIREMKKKHFMSMKSECLILTKKNNYSEEKKIHEKGIIIVTVTLI